MITLTEFLNCLKENSARVTRYESAGDGSGGGCDCIGLIIGALRLAGEKWPGIHGSNWAARNAMSTFGPINSASECFPGEIVYKAKEHGENGYDLPSDYRNSPDQRDYYHVGVVTGTAPLVITHCTSVPGGIQRDNKLGAWKWGGKLKYVDYEKGVEPMEEPLYRATVTAESGKTVRMRTGPSTNAWVVQEVPLGAEVEVLDVLNGWSKIRMDNGKTGYMMGKFLREIGETQEITPDPNVVVVPRPEYESMVQRIRELALEMLGLMEK